MRQGQAGSVQVVKGWEIPAPRGRRPAPSRYEWRQAGMSLVRSEVSQSSLPTGRTRPEGPPLPPQLPRRGPCGTAVAAHQPQPAKPTGRQRGGGGLS